jgi:hypothetical protein
MKIENSHDRKLNDNMKEAKLDQCKGIPKILEKLNKDISEIDSKIKDGKKIVQNSSNNNRSAAEECLDLKNLVKQSVDGLNDIFNVKISKNVGLNVHSSCRNLASSKGFEIIEEELDNDKNIISNNEEGNQVKKHVMAKFKGKLNSSNTNNNDRKKQQIQSKEITNNNSNISQVSTNNVTSLNSMNVVATPETKTDTNTNNELLSSSNNPLKNSNNKKFKGIKNISEAKITPTSKKSTANKIEKIANLNNFKIRKFQNIQNFQNPTIEIKTQITPNNNGNNAVPSNSTNVANNKRNDRYTNVNNSNISNDRSDHTNNHTNNQHNSHINKSPNPKNYQLKPRRELKTSDQINTSNRQNSGAYSSYKTEAETANSLSKNSSKKQIGNIKILHQGSHSVSKNKNYGRSKTDGKNNLFHYNKFSRNKQDEEYNVLSLMNIIFLFNESNIYNIHNNEQLNDEDNKNISQGISQSICQGIANFTRQVIREQRISHEMISTQNIVDNQGFEEKEIEAIKKIQRRWRNFKVYQNLKVKDEESKVREIKNELLHSLHTNETFQIINSHLKTCLKLFKSLGANKSIL